MHIGFCGMSFGVSLANVGDVFLAVREHCRMYGVHGSGCGHAIAAGAFQSFTNGGSFIPDQDDRGRSFPGNLQGKQVNFAMEGLPTWGGDKRLSILIQEPSGAQRVLYQWTGLLPIISNLTFEFGIDGTASVERRGTGRSAGGDALVSHITYRFLLYGERQAYGAPNCLFQSP